MHICRNTFTFFCRSINTHTSPIVSSTETGNYSNYEYWLLYKY